MVAPTGTEGSEASGAESGTTGDGRPMVAPTKTERPQASGRRRGAGAGNRVVPEQPGRPSQPGQPGQPGRAVPGGTERYRAVPSGTERCPAATGINENLPHRLRWGEVFGVKPGRAVPSGNGRRRRFTVYLLKRSLSFLRKPVRLVSFFSPPSSANFLSRSFCSCVSWRGTSTVTVKTRLPRLPL